MNKGEQLINKINRVMKARKIKRVELAQALGREKSVISNWLNGRREPDINTIGQIEDYLGIELLNLKLYL